MRIHKVTVYITDELNEDTDGIDVLKDALETSWPVFAHVVGSSQTVDIGEWDDSSPINRKDVPINEIEKLFQ